MPSPLPSAAAGSARTALRIAARLLKAGQYREAITPLRQAVDLAPSHPRALGDLGLACLRCGRLPEAIDWLQRAIAVQPDLAETHLHLGSAREQTGNHEAALAAYRRAIALDAKLLDAHRGLTELLLARGRRGEAAAAFDRAAAAAGDTATGRLWRARALLVRAQTEEAETDLRRLIARDPSSGEAHGLLGDLLTEAGRFDEAATHIERQLALAPREVARYHTLAQSRHFTEADRPLLARMVARLDDRDIAVAHRMLLHFAVGKALDDLGDYAGAMQSFDAANRIRRGATRFDRDHFRRNVDRLIARYTGEFLAGAAALGRDDATPILILGMPRSGTTLIDRIVSSHQAVASGGELDFWNENAPAWMEAEPGRLAPAAERLAADYRRVLGSIAPAAARVTDKMPFNFLWLGLIHLIFPNARIIHCRRNPIDTCLSIYTNHFVASWGFTSDRGDLAFVYRQYVRLMDHWRTVLPAARLLDVDYEELTADPAAGARRLVEFCGLDWDAACLAPERNRDAVRTVSLWQARQPVYRRSVERWRHYEPWLGELRELLPG